MVLFLNCRFYNVCYHRNRWRMLTKVMTFTLTFLVENEVIRSCSRLRPLWSPKSLLLLLCSPFINKYSLLCTVIWVVKTFYEFQNCVFRSHFAFKITWKHNAHSNYPSPTFTLVVILESINSLKSIHGGSSGVLSLDN